MPEQPPASTKSPSEKGWEARICIPPAALDRKLCRAREKASPTTDSTATREVASMFRHSITIMTVTNHSPAFASVRSSVFRGASSLERPKARSSTFSSSFMATRQAAATSTALKILLAVMFLMLSHRPLAVSSGTIPVRDSGIAPPPFSLAYFYHYIMLPAPAQARP